MEKKQITLRIDNELYEALVKISCETGISINEIINLILLIEFNLLNLSF